MGVKPAYFLRVGCGHAHVFRQGYKNVLRMMSTHNQKVISIRRHAVLSDEAREVADFAYGLWLAHGFRDCTPEEALFTALQHLSGRVTAGLFLVPKLPKRNSVRRNICPLHRVARK
jgi:hypothetical protein